MKFADEIMNNKKARIEQKLKNHNELVNTELLEVEKVLNKYESDLEDTKPYIDIPIIIKTQETKENLKEHKFYIDKINQDIPYGTTRVYLTEDAYKKAIGYAEHVSKRMPYKSMCDPFKAKETEEKVKKEKQINEDNNRNPKKIPCDNEMNITDIINFIESLTKR